MRTLTLFSTTDLPGSLQILPVLFHRVNGAAEVSAHAIADLLRAGGVTKLAQVQLAVSEGGEPQNLIPALAEGLRAGAGKIVLDHATGALIQEAFMTTFRADVTRHGTLEVTFATRAPRKLELAISRAIPSMSTAEANLALQRRAVLMTFPMLVDLLVEAIGMAAAHHAALNAGEIANDLPLTAQDIVSGLVIEPLHKSEDVA
jgi:hypothetical protein